MILELSKFNFSLTLICDRYIFSNKETYFNLKSLFVSLCCLKFVLLCVLTSLPVIHIKGSEVVALI